MRPIGKAQRGCIANRSPKGAFGDVDAEPSCPRIFAEKSQEEATGSGAQIEKAQRRLAVRLSAEHGIDDGLRLRPRIKSIG
jgi:hypothetical protein